MSEYLSFYVQRYFMSYLMKQHNYGSNTISSYRDTFRLLLAFMAESNADISKIEIYDISHDKVLEFMTWLAEVRKNGVSTKNVRLAHIKSFFRYVMMTTPEHLRIPVKRRARSGGTVRPFQRKRRSRSILNGVKRRPSVLSDQRSQFLTELRPLVS